MIDLPIDFLNEMKRELKDGFADFAASYSKPAEKGLRVNTLKISKAEFQKISPVELKGEVPWADGGYYCAGEGLGKNVLHASGLYYVQEPSAMCAAPELEVKPYERVLDLCAAPGGKATQLAANMQGNGIIVMNEINYSRCGILASNVERLGVKNAVITCKSPKALAESAVGFFDKILVDAPCSGEGMFKKEEKAVSEWSLANVERCAKRQTEILDSADKMLSVGGRLVYSTCTFAKREDENQIENFLKTHGNYKLLKMYKLLPHRVRGEGHFCAVLEKTDGQKTQLNRFKGCINNKKAENLFKSWACGVLNTEFSNLFYTGNADCIKIYALPEQMPDFGFKPVTCGVQLATVNSLNGKVEPSHSLAMCLKNGEAEFLDVDLQTALKYLRGLTFDCDANLKGWKVISYLGYPIGWCKTVNGVVKNHLPKGLRI